MQPVADGQTDFQGGQDDSFAPNSLGENQYYAGVNITTTDSVIAPRWGYERIGIKFPTGSYVYRFNHQTPFKYIFESGRFQALAPYRIGTQQYLCIVVNGVIFLVNTDDFTAVCLTYNRDTQLDETAPRINWSDGGRFLVLFDYPARPIIVDGQRAYRSIASEFQVPVSNLGTYNQSRLFVSNYANDFIAGDVVGNPLTPDAPITFEETLSQYAPFSGDVYKLPSKYDKAISAMGVLEQVDGITAIGSLFVASTEEIWTYNTTQPRDTWLQGEFGKRVSNSAGIVGARAFTNVNSDMFFVSGDGRLRALSVAQSEQHKWARVPMDVQVEGFTKVIDTALLPFTTVTYFNNKIFRSVRPYRTYVKSLDNKPVLDVAHSGFVVLENANVSRFGKEAAPAWAGLWTGVHPMDACTIGGRMFIMSKDSLATNRLYEVDTTSTIDKTEIGETRQIRSIVYTREHFFQDMFTLKDLHSIELGVSNIRGAFSCDVKYKPTNSSNYINWGSFQYDAPYKYCQLNPCGSIPQLAPTAFREILIGVPDEPQGDPVTKDSFKVVKRVQYRLEFSGDSWNFTEYKINAVMLTENKTGFLYKLEPQPVLFECTNDWYYREFGLAIVTPPACK